MGAYERFTPTIVRDQLSSTEIELIEDLVGLSYQSGDILYYNGTQLTVLHKGDNSEVLTLVAGLPSWETNTAVGTVTSVSIVSANGVSGTVATETSTPAITLVLGAITPSSVTSSGVVRPSADDGAGLGASGQAWSDLFLASGAVIDFAGDLTLTHSSNLLTLAGGDLALGANSLTMTGSLGTTGARLTKGWFTDLEVTNAIVGSITGNAATVTAADEATDASCFVLFVTAATGNLAVKTNAGLAFNSSTGVLTATGFSGPLTGNVTGNVSGTAATVTGAAQTAITSLGTLTALDVDNININGNTISSTAGVDLNITPLAGQQLVLDGSLEIDGVFMRPVADDGVALGDATHNFSDLFLASGAVINWNAGDVTLTHSAGKMHISGGLFGFSDAAPTAVTGFERVVFEDADGSLSDWSFRIAGGGYAAFNSAASRGTLASPTASGVNDVMLQITAYGHDGTNYLLAGMISFQIPTTTGTNDMPGQIIFYTTSDAASSPTARVIIGHDASFKPDANDGVSLGINGKAFSDLWLASGALIVFNGALTITHSLNLLTIDGGGLALTGLVGIDYNPGSDADTDIITIGVTGAPRVFWDESQDKYSSTKGWEFSAAISPVSNDGAALGTTTLAWADLYLATGGNILVNNANAKRTLVLSAAGGSPTTTIGCGGPTKVEAGTNDIDYWALEFDTTTQERAFWNVQMPDNWDGSTLTAVFVWTNAAGLTTETVRWAIKARAYADSDAIDQAYGSEVTVDDTWLAQGDVHISAATSAITVGGSPAGGQWVVFNVGRIVASDNMTGDARLLAVKIEYGINAYSD